MTSKRIFTGDKDARVRGREVQRMMKRGGTFSLVDCEWPQRGEQSAATNGAGGSLESPLDPRKDAVRCGVLNGTTLYVS